MPLTTPSIQLVVCLGSKESTRHRTSRTTPREGQGVKALGNALKRMHSASHSRHWLSGVSRMQTVRLVCIMGALIASASWMLTSPSIIGDARFLGFSRMLRFSPRIGFRPSLLKKEGVCAPLSACNIYSTNELFMITYAFSRIHLFCNIFLCGIYSS